MLDVDRRELRRNGAPVSVEPQVLDLLLHLVRAPERVVGRDELLAAVWPGRIVSESTIGSRINAARTAIGDDGASQRLIRTLPRKGFRFVGTVVEEPDAAEPSRLTAVLETVRPRMADPRGPAIAVLPFTNMSGDPDEDYFADGIAEDITTALSRCSRIFVIARNSAFMYRGAAVDVRSVGRDLGVGYVLEGSVRRRDDRLRIGGQLVDATTGVRLWADRYDGPAADVFDLQDHITARVVAAIEPTVHFAEIERHRPLRLDAYDLLLRASGLAFTFEPGTLAEALRCLDEALALDPSYAPAMAAFAHVRALCHFQGWLDQDDAGRADAVSRAWKAVELAPNDAQVLWMAAFAIWNMAPRGRDAAAELFGRSLHVNPNSAIALSYAGWIETMRGHVAAGRELLGRARRLSPRDPHGWISAGALAVAAIADHDFPQSIVWAERALAQNRRHTVALRALAVAEINEGRADRARAAVDTLLEIEPRLTISEFFERIPFSSATMARTYADGLRAAGLPP